MTHKYQHSYHVNSLKLRNTELLMSNDETHIGTQPSLNVLLFDFFFKIQIKKVVRKTSVDSYHNHTYLKTLLLVVQHLACIKNIKFNTRKDHA